MRKTFIIFAIFGIAYLIYLLAFDARMDDGALSFSEMRPWEFPILAGLLFSIFGLWFRGIASASKTGGAIFWFALLIWPFGVYLAFKKNN